jgi:hypothetical protein
MTLVQLAMYQLWTTDPAVVFLYGVATGLAIGIAALLGAIFWQARR